MYIFHTKIHFIQDIFQKKIHFFIQNYTFFIQDTAGRLFFELKPYGYAGYGAGRLFLELKPNGYAGYSLTPLLGPLDTIRPDGPISGS